MQNKSETSENTTARSALDFVNEFYEKNGFPDNLTIGVNGYHIMVLGFYWCEVRVATGPGLEDYGDYVKEYVWENGYEEMLDCEIEVVGKTIRQILQEQTPEQVIFI